VTAARWQSGTPKNPHFLQNHRYFHSVYGDNLDPDVERLYGLLDSLDVGLSNVPDTGLNKLTQYCCSHQVTGVSQLYNTQQCVDEF